MKAIRAIFPFIRHRWLYVLTYTLANLLSVIFSTLTVGMIGPFLDMLFGKENLITQKPDLVWNKEGVTTYFKFLLSDYIASHNNDKVYGLLFICAVVIIATFFKNIFLYIAKYTLHPLRNEVVKSIRSKLYQKMLSLPVGFFTNERKGDMLSRITNDVNAVELSVIALMELLFSTPVTVVFYFLILLYISPKLFLFLLVLLPIAGTIIGRISKSLKQKTRNTQDTLGSILSMVEETLGGLRIIKAFRAENQRKNAFETENHQVLQLNNQIASRRELASPLSEFMGISILCVIIWYGGNMALKQPADIEPGLFIMFISLFYFLINPLKALSGIFYNLHQGQSALDRIEQVMEAPNTITDKDNAISISTFQHCIEFKQVGFQYGGVDILHDINLTITKGKTIAIVGASGAGKSTLVDLIPRFHDAHQGQILVDGVPIQDYKLDDLRALMGIVTQEPVLFNDTILNNIALGEANPNEEIVVHAAMVANAWDFIQSKTNGLLDTVGDRGSKLSGGEKQRITIARAVYKNPPILILDEATSSLDTVSERQVQEAIDRLMANRTSIIIAHRLSTVQNADEIIVLEKGRIKERGNHISLIALNGLYKQLVDMQQVLHA